MTPESKTFIGSSLQIVASSSEWYKVSATMYHVNMVHYGEDDWGSNKT